MTTPLRHSPPLLPAAEYIWGDQTTTWGALRAADGHPEPYKITTFELGEHADVPGPVKSWQGRRCSRTDPRVVPSPSPPSLFLNNRK